MIPVPDLLFPEPQYALDGLFASITERATVDQTEGRLGIELRRIRELFEAANPRSMLIMDERGGKS